MNNYLQSNWPRLLGAAVIGILCVIGAIPDPMVGGAAASLLFMVGDTTITDIKKILEDQGRAVEDFKKGHATKLDKLQGDHDAFIAQSQRPGAGGDTRKDTSPPEMWIDTKTKRQVAVLAKGEALAALEKPIRGTDDKEVKSNVGRVLRGLVMGGAADDAKDLAEERKQLGIVPDPDGGYTVSGMLASQWIDRLRARMVLTQAGARTVPMDAGTLAIAKVTGDPTVSWHGENAALTATKPTFAQVTLRARTAVCLVKMSLELSQDSANIEQILQSTITSALATEIDRAGLLGASTDSGAAPWGLLNAPNINKVLAIGTPADWDKFVDAMYELLADNVSMADIGALVAHPKLWKQMRKLKTGLASDKTPLVAPQEIAALAKLWTTACPEAKAVIGDWRDLLFGVRKAISVRVLQEAYMASNLQVAVLAYARVDFVAAREESFCSLEGLTYS